MKRGAVEPLFFATPEEFRAWFSANAASTTELLVGFYRKGSGLPSITWPEAVDEALCVGWIDGVRKGRDETSYTIRFTPRRTTSNWSAINIARIVELTRDGLMQPPGERAFAARREDRSAIYAYENAPRALEPEDEELFRSEPAAWEFFSAQPPSYRQRFIYRVRTAKKKETHDRRLRQLIDASAAGKRL